MKLDGATPWDEKIAELLSEELTLEEIGQRLGLPQDTVRRRYLAICRKLGERPDEE